MCAGVGKSGSPAPKPITSSPAALSALARASMASVADSAMAATRREMVMDSLPRGRTSILAQVTTDTPKITIPAELLPSDGRFGSGPSKVRQEAVDDLAAVAPRYLGTSHRQATVKSVVGR